MAYYRTRTVWTGLAGAPYLTTLNFGSEGDDPEEALLQTAALWDAIDAHLSASAVAQVQGLVQTVDEGTGLIVSEEFFTPPAPTLGDNVGTNEWTAKQGILHWSSPTFIAGKRMFGRTFLPGVTNTMGEQAPNATYRNGVNAAVAAWLAAADAANTPLMAVRRPSTDPGADGAIAAIQTGTVRNQWGVLRSRRT